MENKFANATNKELELYCQKYRDWQKTGMIPDNELGKMRDIYSAYTNTWQVNMIADLLDVLMDRWMEMVK